jgi:hypothetical protein
MPFYCFRLQLPLRYPSPAPSCARSMPNHDCLCDECLPGSIFDIYRDAHSDNEATLDITNALSPRTSVTTISPWVGKADHASAVNNNLRSMGFMPATGPTLAPSRTGTALFRPASLPIGSMLANFFWPNVYSLRLAFLF